MKLRYGSLTHTVLRAASLHPRTASELVGEAFRHRVREARAAARQLAHTGLLARTGPRMEYRYTLTRAGEAVLNELHMEQAVREES